MARVFSHIISLTCFMFSSKVVASKIFILYQNITIFLTMSGQISVNRLGWSRLFGNLVQNLVACNTADITPRLHDCHQFSALYSPSFSPALSTAKESLSLVSPLLPIFILVWVLFLLFRGIL